MADSITQQQLAQAISRQVANSSGESIGLKTLRRDLEEEFGLAKRALDPRRDEIKELLLAAMNQADEPRGRARTGASASGGSGGSAAAPSTRAPAETIMAWEEEPEEAKGKNRSGQKADFEGFLKKRGDTGRIKLWQKRHFRLYKDEGVIAYFKNDKETSQLGEISVVGAFLIEKRDDVAKLAFTITMKTTARVWWLQGKDEAQRQSWIDACTPLMKEDVGGVESKRKKPPLGEPLRFPPTYVQGWATIEQSKSVLQQSKHWAGLLPKPPAQVELADGQVAVTIKYDTCAVVEEVRNVALDADKNGFIHGVPKELKYSAATIQWTAADSQLTQAKFLYDNKTQEDLLKRLVGQEIEVSARRGKSFGDEVTFKGKVAYVGEDRKKGERTDLKAKRGHQYALVDEGSNTVHFLNTKDAHSFNLLAVDAKSLSAGSDEVFAEPRIWGHFDAQGDASLGQLTYHLEDAFSVEPNYVVTLNPNETVADVQGWFNIENKSSRTYENATVAVVPGPPKKVPVLGKDGRPREVKEDAVEDAVKDAAEEAKAKVPGLGALAALASKFTKPKPPPPNPKEYHYPLVEQVTLPAYDWAHASFLHQPVSSRSQHLIRFETPQYTVKPVTVKESGADAAVRAFTVVSFKNPLDVEIPAGLCKVNRREASNHGARDLGTVAFPRVQAGERVLLELETIEGVTVTRTQTGFNFDSEKRFIIESYEITVANGRQELIHLSIEESMHRWATYEITNTWPQYKVTPHPRIIRWVTSLNHGEDITIRYTVFYNQFELDDWADGEEGGEGAPAEDGK